MINKAKSKEEIDLMWENFFIVREKFEKKSPEYTKAICPLIENYYNLVLKIANRMEKKLIQVQSEDLFSWGIDRII